MCAVRVLLKAVVAAVAVRTQTAPLNELFENYMNQQLIHGKAESAVRIWLRQPSGKLL